MPKKKISETVDTKDLSAMTTEESESKKVKPSDVVEKSDVSKTEKPKVMTLDDFESFDPSASHEDLSEDDVFDDEDESY